MIEGVRVISVPTFVDDRGYVNQIIQASDDVFPKLERLYLVGNFGKGVIRGLHKHNEEWKCFFACIFSEIKYKSTYSRIAKIEAAMNCALFQT